MEHARRSEKRPDDARRSETRPDDAAGHARRSAQSRRSTDGDGPHAGTLAVRRGIESAFASHEQAITNIDSYVKDKCADEMDALKRAQDQLNKKIKEVTASREMETLEDAVYNSDRRVQKELRSMQRELQNAFDAIQDDITLDKTERERRLRELTAQMQAEYTRLSKAYPATMRAQMLRNLAIM